MTIKMNGEVPFPQAGEGCFICFPHSAIAKLEEIHGVGEYFEKIEMHLNNASSKTMIECLSVGLFRRNAEGKRERVPFDPDEISFPTSDAAVPILDALSLSSSGKTYEELVQAAIERQAAMEAALNGMDEEVADDSETDPSEA